MADFDGLRAIVTGGASGIGLATAQFLAARGARVACLDLRIDELPAPLLGVVADVSDDDTVRAAMAARSTSSVAWTSSSTTPASARSARWRPTPTTSGAGCST